MLTFMLPLREYSDMDHAMWWDGVAGALIGAVLGSVIGSGIPLFSAWNSRRVERRGELTAIQDELRQTKDVMKKLLATKAVKSTPLRVPQVMLERGYPKLIGEGLLTSTETSALVEYITNIEALNRALDQAGHASTVNHTGEVHYQVGLAMTSAQVMLRNLRPDMGDQSIFSVVEQTFVRLRNSRRMGR